MWEFFTVIACNVVAVSIIIWKVRKSEKETWELVEALSENQQLLLQHYRLTNEFMNELKPFVDSLRNQVQITSSVDKPYTYVSPSKMWS